MECCVMGIRRSTRPVGAARIRALAGQLLNASSVCAIATVSPRCRAHVNVAYFAWSSALDVVWLSDPQARHSRNVRASNSVAIAVYDSRQSWGERDRGIQLFGVAREVVGAAAREAETTYAQRFAEYAGRDIRTYPFYRFRPRRLKLFDERVLGGGVFVTARISGGRIAWERTDIYDESM
jgi:uncharacterized protein YhbP (UPF0306 family)